MQPNIFNIFIVSSLPQQSLAWSKSKSSTAHGHLIIQWQERCSLKNSLQANTKDFHILHDTLELPTHSLFQDHIKWVRGHHNGACHPDHQELFADDSHTPKSTCGLRCTEWKWRQNSALGCTCVGRNCIWYVIPSMAYWSQDVG